MECNAVECNGMESMECNAVEWNGILSILDPFGTFGYFGSILGHLLDKKTPFQNVVPSGRICWSFVGQKKNISKCRTFGQDSFGHFLAKKKAISKCRTFGPDLLGRSARPI